MIRQLVTQLLRSRGISLQGRGRRTCDRRRVLPVRSLGLSSQYREAAPYVHEASGQPDLRVCRNGDHGYRRLISPGSASGVPGAHRPQHMAGRNVGLDRAGNGHRTRPVPDPNPVAERRSEPAGSQTARRQARRVRDQQRQPRVTQPCIAEGRDVVVAPRALLTETAATSVFPEISSGSRHGSCADPPPSGLNWMFIIPSG